jgi:hypothetical protein
MDFEGLRKKVLIGGLDRSTAGALKSLKSPCSLGLSAVLFHRRNNVFLSQQISERYFLTWLFSKADRGENWMTVGDALTSTIQAQDRAISHENTSYSNLFWHQTFYTMLGHARLIRMGMGKNWVQWAGYARSI